MRRLANILRAESLPSRSGGPRLIQPRAAALGNSTITPSPMAQALTPIEMQPFHAPLSPV